MPPQPFQTYQDHDALDLHLGGTLHGIRLAYETWGQLNAQKDNAIVLFPGLSASSHARSHSGNPAPGWWEAMLGPGAALDTDRFFVICVNHLGGCFGSLGPADIDPARGRPFGPTFPPLLIRDMVQATHRLVRHMNIPRLHTVIGPSMGGMLASEYAASFPEGLERLIVISSTGRAGPHSIAFRYVQRQVILNDPHYHGGWYYDRDTKPEQSLGIARQIGNISYRSRQEWEQRFGRQRSRAGYNFGPDFQVESYLNHMGRKLANHFDANSFMILTKAMDLFSLGWGFPTYQAGLSRIQSRSLIIGVTTDMLFPIDEQEQLFHGLRREGRDSQFETLESNAGHDAFLVDVDWFTKTLSHYLTHDDEAV